MQSESQRIQQEYLSQEEARKKRWTVFNPVNIWLVHEREKLILDGLAKLGYTTLEKLQILDIGCGYGHELAQFLRYGAHVSSLHGIDLLDYRIEQARKNYSNIDFRNLNAEDLPFTDNSIDIILLMTVFSSIQSSEMKALIGKELSRILKPEGIIIWYDILPTTRGMKLINQILYIIVKVIENPQKIYQKLARKKAKKENKNTQTNSKKYYLEGLNTNEILSYFSNLKIERYYQAGDNYHSLELKTHKNMIIRFFSTVIPRVKTHLILFLKA